jgi:S-formylglutathione hydrolase FrmB
MAMLVEDLAPLAAERAGVAEPLGLHGWSMGGYGALLAAAEQRLPVRAVATSAAALWTSQAEQADAVGDAFDGPDDYAAHDVLGRAGGLATPVRLACGRSDPFYSANRALAGALPVPTLPEAEPSFPDGCHDERFWQVAFPGHLAFFRTALA